MSNDEKLRCPLCGEPMEVVWDGAERWRVSCFQNDLWDGDESPPCLQPDTWGTSRQNAIDEFKKAAP